MGANALGCNDDDELVHVVGWAPCRKHADVAPHQVVGIEESFHMLPCTLDRVRMRK